MHVSWSHSAARRPPHRSPGSYRARAAFPQPQRRPVAHDAHHPFGPPFPSRETIPLALPWLGFGPRPARGVPRGGGPTAARMDRPAPPTPAHSGRMIEPRGARGPVSGRPFEPADAGGPVRHLTTDRVQITHRGVDAVARHLARFDADLPEPDPANAGMVGRLRAIADGALAPAPWDRNFYTHELREFVRYRRRGWPDGRPANKDARHTLWENTHTATLEDYRLNERDDPLYHPQWREPL